jgi:hypothetical protein
LSAWIIQDGNYPDFAVGDTVELAVEFYLRPGTAVDVCESEVCARPVAENRYAVVAEKVLAAEDVTVLDLGILAYHDGPLQLPETKRGGRLRTALDLTVDRYFYFERLSQSTRGGSVQSFARQLHSSRQLRIPALMQAKGRSLAMPPTSPTRRSQKLTPGVTTAVTANMSFAAISCQPWPNVQASQLRNTRMPLPPVNFC